MYKTPEKIEYNIMKRSFSEVNYEDTCGFPSLKKTEKLVKTTRQHHFSLEKRITKLM